MSASGARHSVLGVDHVGGERQASDRCRRRETVGRGTGSAAKRHLVARAARGARNGGQVGAGLDSPCVPRRISIGPDYRVPTDMREQARQRGARPGRERGAAALFLRLLARHIDARTRPPPSRFERLGRQRRHASASRAAGASLVVDAEREPRQDLAAEPARADAVAGVAGAVVDPRPGHGAEERAGGRTRRRSARPRRA